MGAGAGAAAFPQLPPCQGHPGPLSTPLCEAASSCPSLPPFLRPSVPPQWGGRPGVQGRCPGAWAWVGSQHFLPPSVFPLSYSMAALALTLSLLLGTAELEFLGTIKVQKLLPVLGKPSRPLQNRRPPAWRRPLPPRLQRHLEMGEGAFHGLRSCGDEDINLLPKIQLLSLLPLFGRVQLAPASLWLPPSRLLVSLCHVFRHHCPHTRSAPPT